MSKQAHKFKRLTCFIMAVVIMTFSAPLNKPKETKAAAYVPIVVQGVEIAFGTYQAMSALNSIAGIDFATEEEFRDYLVATANQAANRDIDNFKKILEVCGAYDNDYENNPVIDIKVSDLKDYFRWQKEFYVDTFKENEIPETGGGTISTINAPYKTGYYKGLPVLITPNIGASYSWQNVSSSNSNDIIFGQMQEIFNEKSRMGFGKSLSLDGKNYYYEFTINDYEAGLFMICEQNGNVLSTFGNARYITVNSSGGIYNFDYFMYLDYLTARRELRVTTTMLRRYKTNSASNENSELFFSTPYIVAANMFETELFMPEYTATVNPINIIQDTDDFTETMTAIETALKAVSDGAMIEPLSDDDYIGVRIPTLPVGLTREEVLALPTTFPTDDNPSLPENPAIDVPIDIDIDVPEIDIPVVEEPDIPFDWTLSGVLDAILRWLASIWQAIISIPSRLAEIAIGKPTLNLDGLKINAGALMSVFPFCVPFDFINALKSLMVTPEAPVYEMDFSGLKYFYDYVWRLDMSEYETLAVIVRWSVWISTFIGLMLVTSKFIKW